MMSAKAGKRPLRSLTAHEKLDAIRRVHDGESKASVARDIGVPESTLRGWCKNEEKISYISRQSSPDTDDSSLHLAPPYEPKEKKMRTTATATAAAAPETSTSNESPFNLSLKASDATPQLEKTAAAAAAEVSPKMSERERNRAELARLSVELGLNRPEMYASTGSALADLTSNIGLLSQWNNLLLQQAAAATSTSCKPKKQSQQAAADTTTSGGLLTTYKEASKQPPVGGAAGTSMLDTISKLDPQKSVEDSVWYWLKTQQMLGSAHAMPSSTGGGGGGGSSTSTATGAEQNTSWFWKWYKQYTQAAQQLQQQQQQLQLQQQLQQQEQPPQILYQQLTKEAKEARSGESPKAAEPSASADNAENQSSSKPDTPVADRRPPSSTHKARAVLDNLLLNNNNNVQLANCNGGGGGGGGKDESGSELSQSEAIEHGDKFLKWLERCSEPSVTAMQIMQVRALINNIKSSADRKNGDVQKAKVRRK